MAGTRPTSARVAAACAMAGEAGPCRAACRHCRDAKTFLHICKNLLRSGIIKRLVVMVQKIAKIAAKPNLQKILRNMQEIAISCRIVALFLVALFLAES